MSTFILTAIHSKDMENKMTRELYAMHHKDRNEKIVFFELEPQTVQYDRFVGMQAITDIRVPYTIKQWISIMQSEGFEFQGIKA
jgi:hypothetical protein